MARSCGMPLSIDVDRYRSLPPDVRMRFDGWLEAESLTAERIVRLTLGEGLIVAERIKLDADGRPEISPDGSEVVLERREFPVRSLPPKDALTASERPA